MLKSTAPSTTQRVGATVGAASPSEARVSQAGAGKKSSATTKILFLLLVVSVAGFAWSYMNYKKYEQKVARLSTPEGQQEIVKQETAALVAKVKRLIVLPEDEEPTVASILDAEGLAKDQPFYKGSHNGDKVLIYVKAQKAIIYDPNRDVLVNVGPVFIENRGTGTPTASNNNATSATTTE